MRRSLILLTAPALIVMMTGSGTLAAGNGTTKPATQVKAHKKTISAICPVTGTRIPDISKAPAKSVYKGKTYYFCCTGCKALFDKNPKRYVKQ